MPKKKYLDLQTTWDLLKQWIFVCAFSRIAERVTTAYCPLSWRMVRKAFTMPFTVQCTVPFYSTGPFYCTVYSALLLYSVQCPFTVQCTVPFYLLQYRALFWLDSELLQGVALAAAPPVETIKFVNWWFWSNALCLVY